MELRTLAQLEQSSNITDQQAVVLFSGAVIQFGQFSVTVNQSQKITLSENRPWRRLRVLSSSSDEN